MKSYLILVRHGESRWNIANKFTGWVDVPLSEVGVHEAMITARRLEDLEIDVAFTSKLTRAQETLNIILAEQKYTGVYLHKNDWKSTWFLRYNNKEFEEDEIPVHTSDKLNERYYGKLQGIDKNEARRVYGEEQVHIWRRSYEIAPPSGESLKQVYKRAVPYFKNKIMKHVRAHQNVLVAAHGNSLRAIIKWIEHISDDDIPHLELETGKPIIYEYENGTLTLLDHIHGFDRPTDWQHMPKHRRKVTSTKRVKASTKKKTPAKKKAVKRAVKKSSSKKKTTTRKKVAKKTTAKKKVTKKTVRRATPKKKVTKKKVTRKAAPKKKVAKRTVKKSSSKKKTTKKSSARKGPTRKRSTAQQTKRSNNKKKGLNRRLR